MLADQHVAESAPLRRWKSSASSSASCVIVPRVTSSRPSGCHEPGASCVPAAHRGRRRQLDPYCSASTRERADASSEPRETRILRADGPSRAARRGRPRGRSSESGPSRRGRLRAAARERRSPPWASSAYRQIEALAGTKIDDEPRGSLEREHAHRAVTRAKAMGPGQDGLEVAGTHELRDDAGARDASRAHANDLRLPARSRRTPRRAPSRTCANEWPSISTVAPEPSSWIGGWTYSTRYPGRAFGTGRRCGRNPRAARATRSSSAISSPSTGAVTGPGTNSPSCSVVVPGAVVVGAVGRLRRCGFLVVVGAAPYGESG